MEGMFSSAVRLPRSEFTTVFAAGRRHHTAHATIITHPSPRLQVAVVVGKKVCSKAVKRNQLRRRVYGLLFRAWSADPPVVAVIVILKPSFTTLSRRAAERFMITSIAELVKSA